jgi:hypothetical protein
MGGATIDPRSLKTKRNKIFFQDRQKSWLVFQSYVTLLYLLIIDFPKFNPLTATGKALCVNLRSKFQIFSPSD